MLAAYDSKLIGNNPQESMLGEMFMVCGAKPPNVKSRSSAV